MPVQKSQKPSGISQPTTPTRFPGYHGCLVYAANLQTAELQQNPENPTGALLQSSGDPERHNGACDYRPDLGFAQP
ncbi:MAG: hypothetical protein KDK37_12935 [Leptospiraceae bacterium]|nr:hypothetical protein [Leptospiraceae bacterium]